MTLTLTETQQRLQKTNFEALPKPRKNKGVRGQLLELALGIPNSSKLTDLVDGELKSYLKGNQLRLLNLDTHYPKFLTTPHLTSLSWVLKFQEPYTLHSTETTTF